MRMMWVRNSPRPLNLDLDWVRAVSVTSQIADSCVSLQLSPIPLDVSVQRSQHANAREHRWPAMFRRPSKRVCIAVCRFRKVPICEMAHRLVGT
jgi:hypothetical protein